MNLIVDIGNSRVKSAVIDRTEIVWSGVSGEFSAAEVESLCRNFDLRRSIVCSTRGDVRCVVDALREIVGHSMLCDRDTPIPIKNSYSTPETLGCDRLAAAVGARELSSAENQLIIDLGTAITIDLVTASGGFEGGVISPGVEMRLRALNEFTAALPKCNPTSDVIDVARSTNEAIEQGVMRGVEYELMGHIAKMSEKYCEIDIIFAGGDAKYFDLQIKNAIFAPSELIFVGLNRILEYNAE